MALPNNNITTTLVRNTIGVPSNAVSRMISLAKTGGTNGVAFDANGYQIAEAEPYWNKWAYHIPGEWDYGRGSMELRIHRNSAAPLGYAYYLGDFRLYNHIAQAPQVAVPSKVVTSNGTFTIGVGINFHEWHLPFDVVNVCAEVTVPADGQTQGLIIEIGGVQFPTIEFSGISETTTSGYVKLYAANAAEDPIVDITKLVYGQTTIPFTIEHTSTVGYMSGMVGQPQIDDVTLIATLHTGATILAAGTDILTGYVLKFNATSGIYSNLIFNLELSQTGEINIDLGQFFIGINGTDQYIWLDTITLNALVEGNDNLAFIMTNVSVS